MKLTPIKRQKLTEEINKNKNVLKKDVLMVTSFRPTKNNSVQVEICQNRHIGGRKQTLLGLLNRSDKRFSSETTLLFDWMTMKPVDFVAAFPEIDVTVEQLEEIAGKWKADLPTGKEATVYACLKPVTKVYDSVNEVDLHPLVTVTEVTETELLNGGFFRGKDADEKAENTIENGTNVMRTGSMEDDEFLVHPETGDKVYRFARTEFKENNPEDKLIEGKITESEFKRRSKRAEAMHQPQEDEDISQRIFGGSSI